MKQYIKTLKNNRGFKGLSDWFLDKENEFGSFDSDFDGMEFDDGTVLELSTKRWHQIVEAGLTAYGYIKNRNIRSVKAKTYRREFKEIEL